MKSRVAVSGHPIHPMLVTLPIGLLTGSVVADLGYIITGRDEMWSNIAFWTLIGGLVSAIPAALAGLGEYRMVARYTDAREMARWHMGINLAVVALFFVSLVLRLDEVTLSGGRFGAAFALSVVAVIGLAISGWLGGEMSYRKHLGVEPDDAAQEAQEQQTHLVHEVQR